MAGEPRRTPLRDERLFRIVFGIAFLFTVNAPRAERRSAALPVKFLRTQVDQHQVASVRPDTMPQTALHQRFRQHTGVVGHLLLVFLEFPAKALP